MRGTLLLLVILGVYASLSGCSEHTGDLAGESTPLGVPADARSSEKENEVPSKEILLLHQGSVPAGSGRARAVTRGQVNIWIWRDREVWQSGDGGASWKRIYSVDLRSSHSIIAVEIDRDKAVWIATRTAVYRTPDSGATWYKVFDREDHGGTLTSIAIDPDTHTVLIGGSLPVPTGTVVGMPIEGFWPAVFRSRDLGKTWTAVRMPSERGAIADVVFVKGSGVVGIGESVGAIFRSADAGTTWHIVDLAKQCISPDPRTAGDSKPIFVSTHHSTVWIGMDNGRVIESRNAGKEWCDKLHPSDVWGDEDIGLAYFKGFCVTGAGIMIGNKANGELFSSLDGGSSWHPVALESGYVELVKSQDGCLLVSDKELINVQGAKAK